MGRNCWKLEKVGNVYFYNQTIRMKQKKVHYLFESIYSTPTFYSSNYKEQYHKIHDVRWTRTANDNNNRTLCNVYKETFLFVLRWICRDIFAFSRIFMRVLKIEHQSILQVMFVTTHCLRKKRSIQWQRMEICAKRKSQNDEIRTMSMNSIFLFIVGIYWSYCVVKIDYTT